MALNEEDVKQLNHERTDAASKARAEAFAAQKAADYERDWFYFLQYHTGQRGVAHGQFYECDANKLLLENWLETNNLPLTQLNLERAYQVNKSRLGNPPTEKYERLSDTQQSRVFPQIKGMTPPPAYAPFTRDEILSWSTARLHKEMAKGKDHVDAINAILAGN